MAERIVSGELDADGGDGDVALGDGGDVGARFLLGEDDAAADPVVAAPARVTLFLDEFLTI